MIWNISFGLKFEQIRKVFLLLNRSDRYKLMLVLIINTGLAFLDLIGVALIGITSAVLIRGLQGLAAGDQVARFLELLNLNELPQRNLLLLLGGCAIFFFILKTILSVYFLRKTLKYMSIRNAQISSSLVSKMLNRPVEKIFSKPIQHQIYNVTHGVEHLVTGASFRPSFAFSNFDWINDGRSDYLNWHFYNIHWNCIYTLFFTSQTSCNT